MSADAAERRLNYSILRTYIRTGDTIIICRNNVAGGLMRGRHRWSVTNTSPRGLRSSEFRIELGNSKKPYQFPGRMKNSTIAPAGA